MTEICGCVMEAKGWKHICRIIFRHVFRLLWRRILCCTRKSARYRRLRHSCSLCSQIMPSDNVQTSSVAGARCSELDGDSDLVAIKISLLGDSQIGKTSFLMKYAGNQEETNCIQMTGLNLIDKTFSVRGVRIAFSVWDVGGDHRSLCHVPLACKDSAAILIMFDLTSRRTLTRAIGWYLHGRRWNQTAIPVLIGTKFDDFVNLPLDIQEAIITQAREYAHAMDATLFFSSATHNINVSKIFKFITARLFNLPWMVQRNLTIGEPIVDF